MNAYRFAHAAVLEAQHLTDLATRQDYAPTVVWRHLGAARAAVDLSALAGMDTAELVAAGTTARAHLAAARFALDLVQYDVQDVLADAQLLAMSEAAWSRVFVS